MSPPFRRGSFSWKLLSRPGREGARKVRFLQLRKLSYEGSGPVERRENSAKRVSLVSFARSAPDQREKCVSIARWRGKKP
jgi:hypothetical protein